MQLSIPKPSQQLQSYHSRIRSTVQLTAGHNVISGLCQRNNGRKDGIRTTGHTESRHFVGAFQLSVSSLENVIGRIAQPRINISQLAEGKQIGGVFAGAKDVGRGTMEGNTPRSTVPNTVDSVGIGFVTTMKSNGIKSLAAAAGKSCVGERARPWCGFLFGQRRTRCCRTKRRRDKGFNRLHDWTELNWISSLVVLRSV